MKRKMSKRCSTQAGIPFRVLETMLDSSSTGKAGNGHSIHELDRECDVMEFRFNV